MSENVVNRVVEIASDVFGEPASALSASTTPDDLEAWDSLAQLNLMLALEDEYLLQFSSDDLERMTSLGAIAELVASRSA